jgi:LPS export ABC transporter protein LptC
MKLPSRFIPWASLGLVIVLGWALAVHLALGSARKRETREPAAEPARNEITLSGVEFTEFEEDVKRWTLAAAKASYVHAEQKTDLQEVHLTVYLKGDETIRLVSREGTLYAGTKNIWLRGGVHADVPRGYRVTTEEAFYDHADKRVSSHTAVIVAGPELRLEGARWAYEIAAERAVVDGGVTATAHFGPEVALRTVGRQETVR